jgi:hypothetical protein
VEREGENERYAKHKDNHNRQLLWHGSRLTNWMGILSQGLRIAPPEAPVTVPSIVSLLFFFFHVVFLRNRATQGARHGLRNFCSFFLLFLFFCLRIAPPEACGTVLPAKAVACSLEAVIDADRRLSW